jgi:hypothetical protein
VATHQRLEGGRIPLLGKSFQQVTVGLAPISLPRRGRPQALQELVHRVARHHYPRWLEEVSDLLLFYCPENGERIHFFPGVAVGLASRDNEGILPAVEVSLQGW